MTRTLTRRRAVALSCVLAVATGACSGPRHFVPVQGGREAVSPRALPRTPAVRAWPPADLGPGRIVARVVERGAIVAVVQHLASAGAGQGPITVATFDPEATRLVLHAGALEPTQKGGWREGPTVRPAERTRMVAAFNGGFRMLDARGGWRSEGRTVVPLVEGAASVIIDRSGRTDVRAWNTRRDAHGAISVRQNLQLLVNRGQPVLGSADALTPTSDYWGRAFARARLVARSALGVTADGTLVWAAGTNITVPALARALVLHHVRRALELDINAPLVRGFLFPAAGQVAVPGARVSRTPVPLVVGQTQPRGLVGVLADALTPAPHCDYVRACARDFFTVLLR